MKVFISWSGERSKQVAELFKVWLSCVIQACKPWVSTQDIQGGAVWFSEIGNQIAETTVGIICLTKHNKDKPWILFEAGALAKGLSTNRVIPFLVDLTPQDIYPPLSQLNALSFSKTELYSLVNTINQQLTENQLAPDVLKMVFETNWPQFESDFNQIIADTPDQEQIPDRKESDILNEILFSVRGFDKRIRSLEAGLPVTSTPNDSGGGSWRYYLALEQAKNFREVNLRAGLQQCVSRYFEKNQMLPTEDMLRGYTQSSDFSKGLSEKEIDDQINYVLSSIGLN